MQIHFPWTNLHNSRTGLPIHHYLQLYPQDQESLQPPIGPYLYTISPHTPIPSPLIQSRSRPKPSPPSPTSPKPGVSPHSNYQAASGTANPLFHNTSSHRLCGTACKMRRGVIASSPPPQRVSTTCTPISALTITVNGPMLMLRKGCMVYGLG
jgi:hypothetical protein